MSKNSDPPPKVVPAQLSFLAIYNPTLSTSDESFRDQIVFYYSSEETEADISHDGDSKKLRHVGLAQGMVEFAKSFSNGAPIDSIDTEKTRVVLWEIEQDWWILASVDLTSLPVHAATSTTKKSGEESRPSVEYSAREVSPPALLLKQIAQAQSIFRLHHGLSLSDLFARLGRDRFCKALDRFWTRFANRWDVLLHGSPAVDAFTALKLAAGGELGVGVGEEEWGSGEREVFEDFASRTDGLLDMVVSRFGDPATTQQVDSKDKPESKKEIKLTNQTPWMGSGQVPNASDGVVFSGVGTVARESLYDVSIWIQQIYSYGEYAYGVKENPTADRKRRRGRNPRGASQSRRSPPEPNPKTLQHDVRAVPPGIPRPIVRAAERSLDRASQKIDAQDTEAKAGPQSSSIADPETWKYYLTFGYGSAWGGGDSGEAEKDAPAANQTSPPAKSSKNEDRTSQPERVQEMIKQCIDQENKGHFLVGLKGDMETEDGGDPDGSDSGGGWNHRILLRTLHVRLRETLETDSITEKDEDSPTDYEKMIQSAQEKSKEPTRSHSRLRVVVYVHRPFIYAFLFKPRAEHLTIASFYHNLHTYFSPLHRPLSASTSPDRITARLASASNFTTTTAAQSAAGNAPANNQPIFDLVYDPQALTIHSSIPNIPEPGTLSAEGLSSSPSSATNPTGVPWTRIEALNVHSAILDTISRTRREVFEIERTGKTSRGWWVVWMRMPASSPPDMPSATSRAPKELNEQSTASLREAFLVRRARDGVGSHGKSGSSVSSAGRAVSGLWKIGMGSSGEKMGGAAAGWGPKGMSEGIGVDARKYVESLLSLNR